MNDQAPTVETVSDEVAALLKEKESAQQPLPANPVVQALLQHLGESEGERFARHKADIRRLLMRIYTETLLPHTWSIPDDMTLDLVVLWLIDLQGRAGVKKTEAVDNASKVSV